MQDTQQIAPQNKDVIYQYQDGSPLPALKSPPEPDGLFRGIIVETPKKDGKRDLFEVVDIQEREADFIASCRPVKAQTMNAVILTGGLLGGWFLVQYLLSLVGIGG